MINQLERRWPTKIYSPSPYLGVWVDGLHRHPKSFFNNFPCRLNRGGVVRRTTISWTFPDTNWWRETKTQTPLNIVYIHEWTIEPFFWWGHFNVSIESKNTSSSKVLDTILVLFSFFFGAHLFIIITCKQNASVYASGNIKRYLK